jgi:hypothetical protein
MTVLRGNSDSLIAVLDAFIHDPLVSWRLLNAAEQSVKGKKGPEGQKTASAAPSSAASNAEPPGPLQQQVETTPSAPGAGGAATINARRRSSAGAKTMVPMLEPVIESSDEASEESKAAESAALKSNATTITRPPSQQQPALSAAVPLPGPPAAGTGDGAVHERNLSDLLKATAPTNTASALLKAWSEDEEFDLGGPIGNMGMDGAHPAEDSAGLRRSAATLASVMNDSEERISFDSNVLDPAALANDGVDVGVDDWDENAEVGASSQGSAAFYIGDGK